MELKRRRTSARPWLKALRKAKEVDAERECTFQPRIANQIPEFMRQIAARQRQQRLAGSASEGEQQYFLGGGSNYDGPSEAGGGLSKHYFPHFLRSAQLTPPKLELPLETPVAHVTIEGLPL